MTYCAVIKYDAGATDTQKISAIREGLPLAAQEMLDLGCPKDEILNLLDDISDSIATAEDAKF